MRVKVDNEDRKEGSQSSANKGSLRSDFAVQWNKAK
jgi:hypothetical protein